MAGVKISNLPAIVAPTLTDIYPSVQGGVTYKVTVQQLNSLLVTTLVTPANGGIVYTDATQLQLLAPTATARQLLLSGANVTPIWSTTTYPLTNAINTLLYASSANVMAALATGNNGALITSVGGVPSISSTLPSAVQANITQLGTQAAALNMGSHQINNVTDPTSAQDAATKNYVDTIAQGITVQGACYAASTGALTVTYANGASGVGATLTNATTQATFSLDGTSPAVNSRVLIKNQVSALQNGIYTVTNVGSGATNWVLTRSTDYDQPAEINPGDLIVVNNGTVNATTSWLQTATIVTVGTDAINFSQFTSNPSTFLKVANNLSDLASAATALVNLGLGTPTGTGNVVRQTSPSLITPNIGAALATSLQFASGTGILDNNGISNLLFITTASAVNYIQCTNAATGGAVSFSANGSDTNILLQLGAKGNLGVGVQGTTAGGNAAAGNVGEYISSNVLVGSAISLTTAVTADVTSISLTAGDWDVSGWIGSDPGSGTISASFFGAITLTSATFPTPSPTDGAFFGMNNMTSGATQGFYFASPVHRISVASTTTVYLVANSVFATSTQKAYGFITARRAR